LPAAVLVILVKFMEKSVVHRQAVLSIKSSAKIKIFAEAKNHRTIFSLYRWSVQATQIVQLLL
jgi:hypothetical protein